LQTDEKARIVQDEEHDARLFATPLNQALGRQKVIGAPLDASGAV
jgi:hypothetical protein